MPTAAAGTAPYARASPADGSRNVTIAAGMANNAPGRAADQRQATAGASCTEGA